MAFSEELKLRIRRRAAYRCCWCERFGFVEVHHVVPQNEGGPDTIDNAAPLCPTCHSLYGANPTLRKQIRDKRDWWFDVAAHKYPYDIGSIDEAVHRVDAELLATTYDADAAQRLRQALTEYVQEMLALIEPRRAAMITDTILDAIPLDTGVLLPKEKVAVEGYCECRQDHCVGHRGRVYCYWSKDLSPWVIERKLYWRCYDETIECPRCGRTHKRGHTGRAGVCNGSS